jgi:hypothetical protein
MDGRSEMKRNLLVIGLVFSLSINLAVFFTIVYNWRYRKETHPEYVRYLPQDLGEKLTARQLEEIRNLRRRSLAKAKELREDLLKQRELLAEELGRAEPNQDKIDEMLRDLAGMQLELEKEVVHDLLRIGELLPPKQRERVLDRMRKRLRHPGGWRAPGYPVTPEKLERR